MTECITAWKEYCKPVGSGVGAAVGNGVGAAVGSGVGTVVGSGVGAGVGFGVGAFIIYRICICKFCRKKYQRIDYNDAVINRFGYENSISSSLHG